MTTLIGKMHAGEKREVRLILNDQRQVLDLRQFDRITSTGIYSVSKVGYAFPVGDLDGLIDLLVEARAFVKSACAESAGQ